MIENLSTDPPADAPAANSSLIAIELDNSFSETQYIRSDGWTSFKRKAFLNDLAERGSVTAACKTASMNARSAYQLRHRDPLFATAWQAALVFAHQRLADDVIDRSISGCVEQIYRDGSIVGERHRYDNRLSIAVLGRLDRQLERAQASEQAHLSALGQWDAFVDAVAEERTADAEAIIAPRASHCEVREVGADFSRFSEDCDLDGGDDYETARVWIDDHTWRTNFPPPDGFHGDEYGVYGDRDYSRQCTPEEWEVLDRRYPDDCANSGGHDHEWLEDERQRVALFQSVADQYEAEGPTTLEEENAAWDEREASRG